MSGTLVFVGSFLVSVVLLSLMFVSSAEVQHLRQFLLAPDPAVAAPPPKPAKAPKPKRPKAEELIALELQAAAEEAEPEPEEEVEEEAAPVDESAEGFRQSKVAIMKFLEQALAGMMKEGFRLDAISKFGCHLFLAGASETLGRRNKLADAEFVTILEQCVGVLGSGPDVAKRFGEKYEEYLLEPGYARMFRAGGSAMDDFLAGKATNIGDALSKAVEQFKNPEEGGKGAGPVAVLFTDIVGSTKLTQQLGDAGAQQLVHLHNSVVRSALKEHRGTEVKHTGDGIMASFGASSDAVAAGISIQRALNQARAKDPNILLHLRVGINAGEPIAENGDLFGTTVQIAARICDKAPTDGVMVSQLVKDLSQGKAQFENKGTFELKGVTEAPTLFNVVIPA